jgi:hypothetical protein
MPPKLSDLEHENVAAPRIWRIPHIGELGETKGGLSTEDEQGEAAAVRMIGVELALGGCPASARDRGMNVDLSDFKKPLVVAGLVCSFVLGAAVVWNTVVHRIPDLEDHEKSQDQSINEKFAQINGNIDKQFSLMHTDLSEIDGRFQDRIKSLSLTVTGLKVNMIRLCGQKRTPNKACSPEALVAEAKHASDVQAQFFDAGNLQLTSGAQPTIADESLKSRLPATYVFADVYTYPAQPKQVNKPDFANVIMWSSAANAAHWHREGNNIKVDFANGDVTFMMNDKTSKDEAEALVYSLNATVDALKSAHATAAVDK